jgi:hypothetical protein
MGTDTSGDTDTDTTGDTLGDAGKKALDAERKARRDAERRASEAVARARELELANERRDVAAAKGLTPEQAKYLTGDSREDLESAADGLLAAFGAKDDDKPASRLSRPKERLRPGAGPDIEDDADAAKVAEQVLGRSRL